ncbi:MAG TPA: hypothetical protein VMW71_05880 [Thermoplasmata archaeon]|nr:hypothetical protein [Thermoplasmata archaeon]
MCTRVSARILSSDCCAIAESTRAYGGAGGADASVDGAVVSSESSGGATLALIMMVALVAVIVVVASARALTGAAHSTPGILGSHDAAAARPQS